MDAHHTPPLAGLVGIAAPTKVDSPSPSTGCSSLNIENHHSAGAKVEDGSAAVEHPVGRIEDITMYTAPVHSEPNAYWNAARLPHMGAPNPAAQQAQTHLETTRARLVELEAENAHLAHLKGQIDALTTKLSDVQAQKVVLEEQNKQKDSEIRAVENKLTAMEQWPNVLESLLYSQQTRANDAETKLQLGLETHNEDLKRWENERRNFQQEIRDLEKCLTSVLTPLSMLSNQGDQARISDLDANLQEAELNMAFCGRIIHGLQMEMRCQNERNIQEIEDREREKRNILEREERNIQEIEDREREKRNILEREERNIQEIEDREREKRKLVEQECDAKMRALEERLELETKAYEGLWEKYEEAQEKQLKQERFRHTLKGRWKRSTDCVKGLTDRTISLVKDRTQKFTAHAKERQISTASKQRLSRSV